jgi:hypothetical protein
LVHAPVGRVERTLAVLWPAFIAAGVLETLIFAFVDPLTLAWFGGAPLEWSRQAVYTVAFFILWVVIATAGALTAALTRVLDVAAHPEAGRPTRGS